MFTEILLISALTAAAALVTTTGAIGFKNVAKHSTKIDIGLTALFIFIMGGTATYGVLIGLVTGLMIAIYTKTIRTAWQFGENRGLLSPLVEEKPVVEPKPRSYKTAASNVLKGAFVLGAAVNPLRRTMSQIDDMTSQTKH